MLVDNVNSYITIMLMLSLVVYLIIIFATSYNINYNEFNNNMLIISVLLLLVGLLTSNKIFRNEGQGKTIALLVVVGVVLLTYFINLYVINNSFVVGIFNFISLVGITAISIDV